MKKRIVFIARSLFFTLSILFGACTSNVPYKSPEATFKATTLPQNEVQPTDDEILHLNISL